MSGRPLSTLETAVIMGMATPSWAGEGRTPPEDLIVWAFLALCALIVVAQVLPLIRIGRKRAAETAEKPAERIRST